MLLLSALWWLRLSKRLDGTVWWCVDLPLPFFLLLLLYVGRTSNGSMGDTSSSLAGGSLATPAESPAEPHSHWATHRAVGPTPSHQPSPETADGAETVASGTAAGALAAWRGVYIDLRPGTPEEGWLVGSGCPCQPILAPQGLIAAENGPCCTGQVQGTGVASKGSG